MKVAISEAPPSCILTIRMIVVDGQCGRVGITTHRNGPKCQKNSNFKKIGKKFFVQRLADRVGRVIRNTGCCFFALVQVATLLMFEPFYRVHTGMVE